MIDVAADSIDKVDYKLKILINKEFFFLRK